MRAKKDERDEWGERDGIDPHEGNGEYRERNQAGNGCVRPPAYVAFGVCSLVCTMLQYPNMSAQPSE